MILIFDKSGKYYNAARTVNQAAELTGNLAGNVSQIINGHYGNMTAKGFYFIKYDGVERESYIDKMELVLEIMIVSWSQSSLQDRIDQLLKLKQVNT